MQKAMDITCHEHRCNMLINESCRITPWGTSFHRRSYTKRSDPWLSMMRLHQTHAKHNALSWFRIHITKYHPPFILDMFNRGWTNVSRINQWWALVIYSTTTLSISFRAHLFEPHHQKRIAPTMWCASAFSKHELLKMMVLQFPTMSITNYIQLHFSHMISSSCSRFQLLDDQAVAGLRWITPGPRPDTRNIAPKGKKKPWLPTPSELIAIQFSASQKFIFGILWR